MTPLPLAPKMPHILVKVGERVELEESLSGCHSLMVTSVNDLLMTGTLNNASGVGEKTVTFRRGRSWDLTECYRLPGTFYGERAD